MVVCVGLCFVWAVPVSAGASATMVKRYHTYVYKAESSLLQGSYAAACLYYDSAFKVGLAPIAVDLHNCAVCAAYTGDYVRLRKLLGLLALKGADNPYFQRAVFAPFTSSPEGRMFFAEFPEYHRKYMSKLENATVRSILNLVQQDIDLHHKPQSSPEEANIFKIMDDSVAGTLVKIMLDNDCLNEEKLGVNFIDSMMSPWPLREVLFNHELLKHTIMITNAIKYGIKNGYLKPEIGLFSLQRSNMSSMGFLKNYFVVGLELRKKVAPPLLPTVKKAPVAKKTELDELCVDSPENLDRKVIFCFRQHLYFMGVERNPFYRDFIFATHPPSQTEITPELISNSMIISRGP
jgi:hypothetical protein